MLFLDLLVPMASAPGGDGHGEPSDARLSCLDPWNPVTLSALAPIVREPKEIKGSRPLPCRATLARPPVLHHTRLLGVQLQVVSLETFRDDLAHPSSVVLALKGDDSIVSIPNQVSPASESWLHVSLSGRPRGLLPRGSHGSGRARLGHPALRCTVSLRDAGERGPRLRERIPLQQLLHSLPRY